MKTNLKKETTMIRILLTLIVFSLFASETIGQLITKNTAYVTPAESSKMIQLAGQVRDIHSELPIDAKIIFKKLPYSDNVGIFNNDIYTGDYSFSLVRNGKYSIEITAKGYFPISELVDATEAGNMVALEKDFWLVPIRKGEAMMLNNLMFLHNKAELAEESLPVLDLVVNTLIDNPRMAISLEGHTSLGGSEDYNFKLSEDRVINIKKYLVEQGISRSRIETAAFGSTKPLVRQNTPEARKINRRVEIRILED